jgi:tudor domain-containing protein 1/4/6/7
VELAAQDVNFSPQQIISTNAITLCFKSPAEFWLANGRKKWII